MADFGAMQGLAQGAGIAQGLASGVDAFFKTRSMLNEEAIKKQLANAQSLDAYSKVLAAGAWPDQADAAAQKFGLIPGGGLLPQQPANQGASNPNAGMANAQVSNTTNTQAGAPGAPLAPSGAGYMNESTGRSLGLTPQQTRAEIAKQADPQYQKGLIKSDLDIATAQYNSQVAPIDKARSSLGPQIDDTTATANAYVNLSKALKRGGEGTPQIVYPMFSRLMNPSGNKMSPDILDAALRQAGASEKSSTEIKNWFANKGRGDLSDESKQAMKVMADGLVRTQLTSYDQNSANAESLYKAPAGSTRIPSEGEAKKWLNTPLGLIGRSGAGGQGIADADDGTPSMKLQKALQEKARRAPKAQ